MSCASWMGRTLLFRVVSGTKLLGVSSNHDLDNFFDSSGGGMNVVTSFSVEELRCDNLHSIHFILVSSRRQKLHPELLSSLMWRRTQDKTARVQTHDKTQGPDTGHDSQSRDTGIHLSLPGGKRTVSVVVD